jgi:ribose transport system substrate-binding protein
MIIGMSACSVSNANAKTSKKHLTIGFTALTFNNPYYVKMLNQIKAVVTKDGGTVVEFDGQMDPAKQMSGLEDMISKKVDGIILNPVDSKAAIPAVKDANAKGIPVITVDNTIDGGNIAEYVHSNNYMGGEVIGEYVGKRLNGKGTIAVIDYPSLDGCVQRINGLKAGLKKYPGIKIVAEQKGGVVTDGMKLGETWLQQYPDLNCIFGINDPNALGALTAIENVNRQNKVFVVAVDGSDEAYAAMKAGRNFGATAAQNPGEMGKESAENMIKLINGQKIEKEIQIPVPLVTKDTIPAS